MPPLADRAEKGSVTSWKTVALCGWLTYSVAVTLAIAASESFDLPVLALLAAPAAVLLGLAISRWWVVLIPFVVSIGLGAIAFQIDCPCYEDGRNTYILWWELFFALPSVVLLSLVMVVRASVRAKSDRAGGTSS